MAGLGGSGGPSGTSCLAGLGGSGGPSGAGRLAGLGGSDGPSDEGDDEDEAALEVPDDTNKHFPGFLAAAFFLEGVLLSFFVCLFQLVWLS